MDKWFLNEKSDGKLGKRGRRNVPGLIQRAQIKELGLDKV